MTDSIRNSSKKNNLICIKPIQEEHLTALWMGLSEKLTKDKSARRRLPGLCFIKAQIFENHPILLYSAI